MDTSNLETAYNSFKTDPKTCLSAYAHLLVYQSEGETLISKKSLSFDLIRRFIHEKQSCDPSILNQCLCISSSLLTEIVKGGSVGMTEEHANLIYNQLRTDSLNNLK